MPGLSVPRRHDLREGDGLDMTGLEIAGVELGGQSPLFEALHNLLGEVRTVHARVRDENLEAMFVRFPAGGSTTRVAALAGGSLCGPSIT